MFQLAHFIPWLHETLGQVLQHTEGLTDHLESAERDTSEFRARTDKRIAELQQELQKDKQLLAKMHTEYQEKL